MQKETKGHKKILITTVIVVPVLLLIIAGISFLLNEKQDKNKTVTQALYDEAIELVKKAPIPTYFDDMGTNSIQNAFLSSTLAEQLDETNDEKEIDVKEVKKEILMDLIFYDEKSAQTINYSVVNYSMEFEDVVANGGELVVLENEQEVYKYQKGYFWELGDGLYASIFSHDENPNDELLVKTILSVGDSKINVFEQMKFNDKTKVLEPTYTMNEMGHAYSVVMDYTRVDEKPISTLSLYYDNFVVYQNYDLDYTSKDFMGDYTEEAFEKIDYNSNPVYIDKTYHSLYYTAGKLSLWVLPNGENTNNEEILKVFQSIEF